jgi:hypothetical protein
MTNLLITITYLLLMVVGSCVGISLVLFMFSTPVVAFALVKRAFGVRQPATALTLASVPETIASESVAEFLAGMSDPSKRAVYAEVNDKVTMLLMDVIKNRDMYPKDLEKFLLLQVDFFLANSGVKDSLETPKFKRLLAVRWHEEALWN